MQLSISLSQFLPSAVHRLIVAELKNRANRFANELAADLDVIYTLGKKTIVLILYRGCT